MIKGIGRRILLVPNYEVNDDNEKTIVGYNDDRSFIKEGQFVDGNS